MTLKADTFMNKFHYTLLKCALFNNVKLKIVLYGAYYGIQYIIKVHFDSLNNLLSYCKDGHLF